MFLQNFGYQSIPQKHIAKYISRFANLNSRYSHLYHHLMMMRIHNILNLFPTFLILWCSRPCVVPVTFLQVFHVNRQLTATECYL